MALQKKDFILQLDWDNTHFVMPKYSEKHKGDPSASSVKVSGAFSGGSGKMRKKIRDIERMLNRSQIPANIRVDNERALKALHIELENAQLNLKTKTNSRKYHMVRFFERKKAIRRLRQAMAKLQEAQASDSLVTAKEAQEKVKQCQTDLAYVLVFPKSEKYISLYPVESNNTDVSGLEAESTASRSDHTNQRRRELLKNTEKLLKNDKLPFSFEDILLGNPMSFDFKERAISKLIIDAPETTNANEEDDFFE